MSGYKPYPKNKESGVKWLREVPEHWEILQSRRLFKERKDRAYPGDKQLTASQKHGILYQDDFAALEGVKVMQVILGAEILKHVEPNDFVISMRTFQGGLEWSDLRGCISSAYVMLIPNEKIFPGFFKWAFKSQPYIQALQSTSNLVRDGQALRFDNFSQVHLPIFPLEEQKSIANFLDRETGKLDALIREQKELIVLLQEKRQALISNSVTKGLDPKSKKKDSGVEWLGNVPEHWVVKKLSYVADLKSGDQITSEDIEEAGNYPVFGGNGLRGYTSKFTHDGFYALIGRQGALCGNINYASGKFWASEHAVVVNPREIIDVKWIGELLREMNLNQYSVSAAQPGLSVEIISALKIVVPPYKEQKTIAAFIAIETSKIDNLISESRETIALMNEHRSSLISEAVTGKIDVRHLA